MCDPLEALLELEGVVGFGRPRSAGPHYRQITSYTEGMFDIAFNLFPC